MRDRSRRTDQPGMGRCVQPIRRSNVDEHTRIVPGIQMLASQQDAPRPNAYGWKIHNKSARSLNTIMRVRSDPSSVRNICEPPFGRARPSDYWPLAIAPLCYCGKQYSVPRRHTVNFLKVKGANMSTPPYPPLPFDVVQQPAMLSLSLENRLEY